MQKTAIATPLNPPHIRPVATIQKPEKKIYRRHRFTAAMTSDGKPAPAENENHLNLRQVTHQAQWPSALPCAT